jgi:hypothetical protein
MTKYIKEVSENVFMFDLSKFLVMQGHIYEKFKFEGKGIDLIDKYVFQTLEEIHEVNSAPNEIEQAGEIVDIMMYLGSTIYTVETFHPTGTVTIVKTKEKAEVKPLMDEVFSSLISARRMFPERKWHKTYNENDIIEGRDEIFVSIIIGLIVKLAELLLTNNFYINVDSMIEGKQRFIKQL